MAALDQSHLSYSKKVTHFHENTMYNSIQTYLISANQKNIFYELTAR